MAPSERGCAAAHYVGCKAGFGIAEVDALLAQSVGRSASPAASDEHVAPSTLRSDLRRGISPRAKCKLGTKTKFGFS